MPRNAGGIGTAPTVTIPGVELVQAGTWAASTGVTTVTVDHLASMVAAAADPGVDDAPMRIGHTDPRFADDNGDLDGEPALGWVANPRVEKRPQLGADGKPTGVMVDTLIGDLVEVPAQLAAVMPKAFRRRSVEIGWGYRTAAGAKYPAVLTGLALLGVTPPAVKGLADVVALYAVAQATGSSSSSATVLASSSFTIAQPDTVASLLAAAATTAGLQPAVAAQWAAALDAMVRASDVQTGHTGAVPTPANGGPMPLDEARMRAILGLAADADVEAAVAQLVAGKLAGTPATPAAPAAPATPAAPAAPAAAAPATSAAAPAPAAAAPAAVIPAAPAAPAPAAAIPPASPSPATAPPVGLPAGFALPEGMSIVSNQVLDELRTGATAAVEAAKVIGDAAVERELVGAFRAGKVTPAEMPQWRAMLSGPGRDQARTLLSALAPKFAATAAGTPLELPGNVDDAQWDAFEASVFGFEPTAPAQNGAA